MAATASPIATATRRALVPGEDAHAYQRFQQDLLLHHRPQDAYQRDLVLQLASLQWRLNRVPDFEATLISLEVQQLTSDPELHPLIENLHTQEEIVALALRRLTENKILPSIHSQESRLAARAHRISKQLESTLPPQPDSENLQNEANSETPAPRLSPSGQPIRPPKTGRNDYCPCGSGLKFKRCCLNQPSDQPSNLPSNQPHPPNV